MGPKASVDLGPHLKSSGPNRPADKEEVQSPQVSKPKPSPILSLDNVNDDIGLQARKSCTKIWGEYKICGNTTSQKIKIRLKKGAKKKNIKKAN